MLPGTGGLTRITDKRKVRRDRADVFCTTEEGIKGKRAVEWRLVDEVVPNSKLDEAVAARVREFAAKSDRPKRQGITLAPLDARMTADGRDYSYVSVELARGGPHRHHHAGSQGGAAIVCGRMVGQGAAFWPLALARELDDAILDIRLNEFDTAVIVFKSEGDAAAVLSYDAFLDAHKDHWLAREIRLKWKRVLKRVDLTSRTLVALIEPGSCFAGTLAELIFAADRSLHAGRPARGRQPAARRGRAQRPELRLLSDAERHHPAFAGRFSARRRRKLEKARARARRQPSQLRGGVEAGSGSPSRPTTSTGNERSASSSKSARASRPTRSPAWRRTFVSAGPRPWNRRSSRG